MKTFDGDIFQQEITDILKRAFLHHGLGEADCVKAGGLIADHVLTGYRVDLHPYDGEAVPGSLLEDVVQKLEVAKTELSHAAREMRASSEEILRLASGVTGEERLK